MIWLDVAIHNITCYIGYTPPQSSLEIYTLMGFYLSSFYRCCFVPTAVLVYCSCIADWGSVKPPPLGMTCFQLVTLLLLLFYCHYFISLSYEKIV